MIVSQQKNFHNDNKLKISDNSVSHLIFNAVKYPLFITCCILFKKQNKKKTMEHSNMVRVFSYPSGESHISKQLIQASQCKLFLTLDFNILCILASSLIVHILLFIFTFLNPQILRGWYLYCCQEIYIPRWSESQSGYPNSTLL